MNELKAEFNTREEAISFFLKLALELNNNERHGFRRAIFVLPKIVNFGFTSNIGMPSIQEASSSILNISWEM